MSSSGESCACFVGLNFPKHIIKITMLRLDYLQEVEKIVAITYSDFHNWNCHSLMLLILNVAQILNGFVFTCILLKTLVIHMCMILSYFLLMSSPIQQAQLISITSFDTLWKFTAYFKFLTILHTFLGKCKCFKN